MLEVLLWAWLVQSVVAEDSAAQGASPVPGPGVWEQYGPATVSSFIFASIAWVLFNMQRETLRIERERSAQLASENRDLNKQISQQLVPAVVTFTGEATRLTQAVTEAIRVMDQVRKDR